MTPCKHRLLWILLELHPRVNQRRRNAPRAKAAKTRLIDFEATKSRTYVKRSPKLSSNPALIFRVLLSPINRNLWTNPFPSNERPREKKKRYARRLLDRREISKSVDSRKRTKKILKNSSFVFFAVPSVPCHLLLKFLAISHGKSSLFSPRSAKTASEEETRRTQDM